MIAAACTLPKGTVEVSPSTKVDPGAFQIGSATQPAVNLVIEKGAVTIEKEAVSVSAPVAVPDSTSKAFNWTMILIGLAIAMWIVPSPQSIAKKVLAKKVLSWRKEE